MPYFAHDGLQFHYSDSGEGLPVVFQHGLGSEMRQVAALFQPPLKFRLLSMDFRAHGDTRPLGPSEKITMAAFADDLLAFMDGQRIGQAVVGGISMGAAVALNFALRFPDRVRALILSRPCWLDQPLPPNAQVFVSIASHIRQHGAKKGREQFSLSEEYRDLGADRDLLALLARETGGVAASSTEDEQAIETKHLGFAISPHEECAVEEAVRLVEAHGGEIRDREKGRFRASPAREAGKL